MLYVRQRSRRSGRQCTSCHFRLRSGGEMHLSLLSPGPAPCPLAVLGVDSEIDSETAIEINNSV